MLAAVTLFIAAGFTAERREGSAPEGITSAAVVVSARVSGADSCRALRKAVRYYMRHAREWRERIGQERVATGEPSRTSTQGARQSCPKYLARLWRSRAIAARAAYRRWFERLYAKWRCIHEHEGAWNDPNSPYWGGLQMTRWFQQTYGAEFYRRWGTADRWPVYAQLIAAERAWKQDGDFGQWGTAPMCGLPT